MYTTLPSNIQFQPILKRSLSRPKRPLFYCLCGVQSKSTSKWSLCTLHHPLRGRHCLRLDDSLARGIGDGSSRGRPQYSIQPPWSRNFISITRNKPRAITHPRQPCSHRPTGCAIRLYTTATLADNDPILLLSFGLALLLNASLLLQILWYGVQVEGLSLQAVFAADLGTAARSTTTLHLAPADVELL